MANINRNQFKQYIFNDFEAVNRADGSLMLIQKTTIKKEKVEFRNPRTDYYGNKVAEVVFTPREEHLSAVVMVMRTSANRLFVIGSNQNYTLSKSCTNYDEASEFIRDNFCRTILKQAYK